MTETKHNNIEIVKANGEREPFIPAKLESSLFRAGAAPEVVEKIVADINDHLEDGMTTKYIYNRAFTLLSQEKAGTAGRYSLRQAVMDLGPTGFPFESFIARLFETRGYRAKTNVYLAGACAEHEIDVVTYTETELNFIEAKFHNERGITSDLKTALYVKARHDDLADRAFEEFGGKKMTGGLLITNTKFSTSAVKYGACAGVAMIGWNYPKDGNLQQYIEESGLQPLTVLTTLSNNDKQRLIENGTVLCRSVHDNSSVLAEIGLTGEESQGVLKEISDVCNI